MKTLSVIFSMLLTVTVWSAEIVISTLDEKKESRRERAFQDWIPLAEKQKQFDKFTGKRKILIFSERDERQTRSLYEDRVKGSRFKSHSGMNEKKLLQKHRTFLSQGYILLSMSQFEDKYWAVWVSKSSFRKYKSYLKRYGISIAKIRL